MRWKNECGQTLVLTALCMSLFLGFMGLALDAGLLFRARRQMQIAADASAIAAATSYKYTGVVATARTAGANAGVVDGVPDTSHVTINCPPAAGPNTGGGGSCNGYFEAVVNQPSPSFFMRFFGFGNVTVAARAVAGTPSASNACVIVTNPSASDSMDLQGSFTVSAPNCEIIVDSTDASALQFTGGGGTLSAGEVAVAGGVGGQVGDSTPAPVTHAAPMSDPIRLTGPTPSNGGCSSSGDGFTGVNGVNSSGATGAETGTTDASTTTLTGTVAGPGASQLYLAQRSGLFQPSEALFDQPSPAQAGGIAGLARGSTVQVAGAALVVPRNVRCHVQLSHRADEILRVVGLVRTHRDAA